MHSSNSMDLKSQSLSNNCLGLKRKLWKTLQNTIKKQKQKQIAVLLN